MSLTKEEVVKISHLARIDLTDKEIEHFTDEINKILKWINILSEVDTKEIESMTSVEDFTLPMFADKVSDGNIQEDILKNAPESAYGCFVVPKVVE